ncbi:MAG: hypothetical protein QM676_09680 [Novosphingobium sp.]
MAIDLRRTARIAFRSGIYLLIAACSQSALETYGCACESRSYTAEEIAGYRAGAARNDLRSLREMQEYYQWRRDDQPLGSQPYKENERLVQEYLNRRLALFDPGAMQGEFERYMLRSLDDGLAPQERIDLLKRARDVVVRSPRKLITDDLGLPGTQSIEAVAYADREIAKVKRLGDRYLSEHRRAYDAAPWDGWPGPSSSVSS